jgi:hexokinase
MSQIPSYVTEVPDGTEKGLYLAVDLGGTNLRVCSVDLHGDTTFTIKQSKLAVPRHLMTATSMSELFAFIAKQVHLFLREHHNDLLQTENTERLPGSRVKQEYCRPLLLGFTFSFAFEQKALNSGTLLRWTKGFNIPDAIGQDICGILQNELDRLHLPIVVAALVNDTVGTLLARSYTSPGNIKTLLGAIFGTGTNGAYVENLRNIPKLNPPRNSAQQMMIINTEWGSFDNELLVLPNTPFDKAVDDESVHPGIQLFEKRVAGMYLGEVLRHAILAMVLSNTAIDVPTDAPLRQQFVIDASFLSKSASDNSVDLSVLKNELNLTLGIDAGVDVAEAVKTLAIAVGSRAARLAGVAIASVILKSGRLSNSPSEKITSSGADLLTAGLKGEIQEDYVKPPTLPYWLHAAFGTVWNSFYRCYLWLFPRRDHTKRIGADIIDIGVDGALIQFYPGFEDIIRSTLRDIPEIGPDGETRIRIGSAQDGSGVGAALVARMAEQESDQKGQNKKISTL